jgi:NAD dependent epimerase/dehydratase family enzyme
MKWLYYPTLVGLGTNIGNGYQYQPWIHICDLIYLILFSIENKQINGILNGVSPEVKNKIINYVINFLSDYILISFKL